MSEKQYCRCETPDVPRSNLRVKTCSACDTEWHASHSQIRDAVYSIFKRVERVKQPPRNAPCPCGSGKKFKKCCLA